MHAIFQVILVKCRVTCYNNKKNGGRNMSKGFRKSLFGFNCEDVLNYISENDRKNLKKINSLTKELNDSNEENKKLVLLVNELSEKAAEYDKNREQIRLLSESVAKMYLTAKTTSKIMLEKTEESQKLIENENNDRLLTIKQTQASLSLIKEQIVATADSYTEEIGRLYFSLQELTSALDKNKATVDEAKHELSSLLSESV